MNTQAQVRDIRYWIRVAGFAVIAFVLLFGLLALALPWLLAYLAVHPFTKTTGETPVDYDLSYQEIRFATTDGLTLRGWYIPGHNGATVILVHGFARDRSELLPEARWLVDRGYGALLFDMRAQGASDGAHITLGHREALDVQAAVNFVLCQSSGERIGAIGYSMGAVATIRAAAVDPRIRAVVAVSPFASLRDLVDQRLRYIRPVIPLAIWWGERMTGIRLDDLRPTEDVAALSPRPILIMQAEADGLVPRDSGQLLYQAAGEPKELWSVPEVAHVGFRQAVPTLYRDRIIGFFEQYLPLD